MNKIRRLPDSEFEIMQAVWSCESPISRADIEIMLDSDRALAPTTILTLLSRLEEKGFLAIEKAGRSNTYTPLIKKADYLAAQSKSFLDILCGGDIQTFATALNDSGLSREDLNELRELLDRGEL